MPGPRTPRFLVKAAVFMAAAASFAAACAPASVPPATPIAGGGDFSTSVVDSPNDAGRGASIVLDQNGDPSVSYLLATPRPRPGQLPAAIIAGQPQPPSVMLASLSEGIWEREAVTGQASPGKDVEGTAKEIVDSEGIALPTVRTGLAIDGSGTAHVAWSTPTGLFYSSGKDGTFSEREKVTSGDVSGGAIAVTSGGTPWISFYEGSSLMAATSSGDGWRVETVADLVGGTGQPAQVTAVALGSNDEPIIAFDDKSRTAVAQREGSSWVIETAPGAGGLGVSLALDAQDNPHTAYYDEAGNIRHAHQVGGTWEVTDLGTTKSGEGAATADPDWGTGIALDDQGVHYVTWADTTTVEIQLATNANGDFETRALPSAEHGGNPSIALSGDGKTIAVAWFDTSNENLDVALSSAAGKVPLAFSPQPQAGPTSGPAAPTAKCSPSGTTLQITAKNIAFDKDCLAAPANTAVKIEFDNQDAGTPHNVEIYTDESATERLGGAKDAGDFISGPATTTYEVEPLEPGDYYFHCDIHPSMNGAFIVAAGK